MDEELTKEALFFFVMFVVAAVLVNLMMSCNCGKCQVCNFTESQMLRGYDEEDQPAEIERLGDEVSRLNKELESIIMTVKLAIEAGALQHFKDLSHALANENRIMTCSCGHCHFCAEKMKVLLMRAEIIVSNGDIDALRLWLEDVVNQLYGGKR